MADHDEEQAIIDWANTFSLPNPCTSTADFFDGGIIISMLSEIAPTSFDSSVIMNDASGNWALSASNFKKILRMLEDYYTNVVHKSIDMGNIDVNSIARERSSAELFQVLELVVGCAVLSEHKAVFIQNIFSLHHESQSVLKGMVERVMSRTRDLGEGIPEDSSLSGDRDLDSRAGHDSYIEEEGGHSEELIRAREMVRYLQEEKANLESKMSDTERSNQRLQEELAKLRDNLSKVVEERGATEDSERSRALSVATTNASLQSELLEAKRELDLRQLEMDSLRQELKVSNDRLLATREMQARLELDARQMADELDLARDKAGQLAKAEATIEKYQRRLEEQAALKKQNQELEAKLDTYLDRIAELESSNKNIATLNRMVEQYKDKAVELEREKFEAISEVQMKADELKRLQQELEEAVEARNFLQEELTSARSELEQFREQHGEGAGSSGLGMFESISSLKEQLKQKDLELKLAKSSREGSGSEEVALLQAELEDTRRVKKEREDMLLATKRQLAEAQAESAKCAKALQEALEHGGGAANSSGISKEQLKELEQQLIMKSNTIRQMEELIRGKETDINKLEQEKAKLEDYAKRTLNTFKDKYMQALQQMKADRRAVEEKLQLMQSKAEKDQETHRREERLLLSSMYELGVRMMDRNIQLEMRDSSANPTTFLAAQRAEQDRNSIGAGASKGSGTSLPPPPPGAIRA